MVVVLVLYYAQFTYTFQWIKLHILEAYEDIHLVLEQDGVRCSNVQLPPKANHKLRRQLVSA